MIIGAMYFIKYWDKTREGYSKGLILLQLHYMYNHVSVSRPVGLFFPIQVVVSITIFIFISAAFYHTVALGRDIIKVCPNEDKSPILLWHGPCTVQRFVELSCVSSHFRRGDNDIARCHHSFTTFDIFGLHRPVIEPWTCQTRRENSTTRLLHNCEYVQNVSWYLLYACR